MADPTLPRQATDHEGKTPHNDSSGTPRLAKVVGVVVGILVLVVLVKLLAAAGGFDIGALHSRIRAMVGH